MKIQGFLGGVDSGLMNVGLWYSWWSSWATTSWHTAQPTYQGRPDWRVTLESDILNTVRRFLNSLVLYWLNQHSSPSFSRMSGSLNMDNGNVNHFDSFRFFKQNWSSVLSKFLFLDLKRYNLMQYSFFFKFTRYKIFAWVIQHFGHC